MATIFLGDISGREQAAREQNIGFERVSRGLHGIEQTIFEHRLQVEREKDQELNKLVAAGKLLGYDTLGQRGARKLEALLGAEFPRDATGNVQIPVDPETLVARRKAKTIMEGGPGADVMMGLEQPAPSKTAVDLSREERKFKGEEAAKDRASDREKTLIAAGATVQAAGIRALATQDAVKRDPRNAASGMFLYRGRLIPKEKPGATPLSVYQADFYRQFKSSELKDIETAGNVELLDTKSRKVAAEIARIAEQSPATDTLVKAAGAAARAGDKDTARQLAAAAIGPLVEKDPDLRDAIKAAGSATWFNRWTSSTLDRVLEMQKGARSKNIIDEAVKEAQGGVLTPEQSMRYLFPDQGQP